MQTVTPAPQESREVRVGVGVVVLRDGRVLLGQRTGSHGAGSWAFPGGHLEYGESPEACARREVREETGLEVGDLHRGPFVSDVFDREGRHYVTLIMLARAPRGEPELREPSKCLRWAWYPWSALPTPLFAPVASLVDTGFHPPDLV
ncbi:MAG: NUDIX domain-containing protein [Piscinibacter sp.]|nr:NUDIX domain-containing protein [Piscinibacter sp.]